MEIVWIVAIVGFVYLGELFLEKVWKKWCEEEAKDREIENLPKDQVS